MHLLAVCLIRNPVFAYCCPFHLFNHYWPHHTDLFLRILGIIHICSIIHELLGLSRKVAEDGGTEMKLVLLKGPGEVVFEDIPVPEVSADEVLVEVKYCGICGSDIHSVPECNLYQAGAYLGHEFSGVVAKVEWHQGQLFPRVGFVVTNLSVNPKGVVHFYNRRGTAGQWIKEGK